MLNPNESNSILIDYDFISKVLINFNFKGLNIEEVKQEESIYSHVYSYDQGFFELFLNRNKNAISIEGDWEITMNFILSFINNLPDNQKVYFLDDSYNNNMIIDSKTTREEIDSLFS